MSAIVRDLPAADLAYEVAPPEYEYPFLKYGDSTAFVLTRFYKQTIAGWNADRLAGRFIPGLATDAEHADAYLMEEPKPTRTQSGMVQFQRVFARLPEEQTYFGTRTITKPSPGTLGASTRTTRNVTGSGTSVLISSAYDYIGYYWDMSYNRVYGPYVSVSGSDSGSDFRVTWSTHGLAGTERIAIGFVSNGLLLFDAGEYSVIDPNTIDLLGFASFLNNAETAGVFVRDYTPGTDRVGRRVNQSFYLPGVTPGIATPTDIPLPDTLLNDANFLAAIAANATGYETYDATELSRWNDWPIYTQTVEEIDMATA